MGLVKIIESCAKGGMVITGLGVIAEIGSVIYGGGNEDATLTAYLMGILFCGSVFVKNLAKTMLYQEKEIPQYHTLPLPYNID